jgi:hypothetical protein
MAYIYVSNFQHLKNFESRVGLTTPRLVQALSLFKCTIVGHTTGPYNN